MSKKVLIVVSILVLASFFAPWLSVSSDELLIYTYNGYNMAREEQFLFALPGAAVLVLCLRATPARAVRALVGALGLVVLFLALQSIQSLYAGNVSFQSHYGLWITTAGLVIIALGALQARPKWSRR